MNPINFSPIFKHWGNPDTKVTKVGFRNANNSMRHKTAGSTCGKNSARLLISFALGS